ncbi:arrestin domain-containing protein 17 [Schistocerca americana]|uniref:arrestin domain-containing protein 17 n=1 Tax=Schistocerca americana TaxID=7009 RepID=UPI001F503D81|nr:arrestin domain-containing protein 17 [Schistocerca americana]
MGLKKLQIVFDNPWSTYYSGQPVSGRLIIDVDSPKKIRAISIQFKGEAYVKWDEMKTRKTNEGNTTRETIVYTAQENYFENKFNLVGGSGEMIIEPGEKIYPFSTHLPPNLPSSFEAEFGYVRYTVKAVLDRPWKFDQEVKSAFTVITPLDLNTHPTAKDPVKKETEKNFCCCCCKSGPLSLVMSIPVGGYVSGQIIPVTVEVDNASNVNVDNVYCALRKVVTFKATSPQRTERKDKVTIAEQNFGSVAGGGSNTWCEQITIPPLPPSNLNNCNIIDLEYDLRVECKVAGFYHRNLTVKTPIILGSIPLASYQSPVPLQKPDSENNGAIIPDGPPTDPSGDHHPQYGPAGHQSPGGFAQPQWGPAPPGPAVSPGGQPQNPQWGPGPNVSPSAPLPTGGAGAWVPPTGPPQPGPPAAPGGALYPTLPQPMFAEGTFGGAKNIRDPSDNQYTQGSQEFTPRYPVYNFQPPQQ